MHSTLREIFSRLSDRRILAIWVVVTFVCILAGPFGTNGMSLTVRSLYWTITNAAALVLSMVLIAGAYAAPFLGRTPPIVRGVLGSAVFSLVFAALMALAGRLAFPENESFPGFWLMLLYVGPIAIGVTFVVELFIAKAPDAPIAQPDAPRILKRLKPGLEARLIRMAMQDHYVEVFTTKGSQLILMRFADALAEVEGVAGWRVHRSHWVAEAAMRDLKRRDGKTLVETEDGALIPISRTYMPQLRDAGVIQRF